MSDMADKITGKAKQAVGDVVGDRSLHREGRKEERKGDAKDEAARAQDRADEKAREVVDPEEGREQGTEGNFRWERQTTVIPAPDLVPTVGVPRWRIYEIDVRVFWDERRQVEVNMLRTMPLTVVATTPTTPTPGSRPATPGTPPVPAPR